jgi:hypothetical protein
VDMKPTDIRVHACDLLRASIAFVDHECGRQKLSKTVRPIYTYAYGLPLVRWRFSEMTKYEPPFFADRRVYLLVRCRPSSDAVLLQSKVK